MRILLAFSLLKTLQLLFSCFACSEQAVQNVLNLKCSDILPVTVFIYFYITVYSVEISWNNTLSIPTVNLFISRGLPWYAPRSSPSTPTPIPRRTPILTRDPAAKKLRLVGSLSVNSWDTINVWHIGLIIRTMMDHVDPCGRKEHSCLFFNPVVKESASQAFAHPHKHHEVSQIVPRPQRTVIFCPKGLVSRFSRYLYLLLGASIAQPGGTPVSKAIQEAW